MSVSAVLRFVLSGFLLCVTWASAQVAVVDLAALGYKQPESKPAVLAIQPGMLTIGVDGITIVGFVTRRHTGHLATRDNPPFAFEVLRLARDGKLIDRRAFPTERLSENAFYSGSDGKLLVRTGLDLRLLSRDLETIAERKLSWTQQSTGIHWGVIPFLDRSAFVLYDYGRDESTAELVSLDDLHVMKRCARNPFNEPTSALHDYLLAMLPSPARDPLLRTAQVSEICGPVRYSYRWKGDPVDATLVSDDAMVLAGTAPVVKLVRHNEVIWQDSFDHHSEVALEEVAESANGGMVAIGVKRLAGGSDMFDIPRHLKSVKVVVYRGEDGSRLKAVQINPAPVSTFSFALSPDGALLAIVADGRLELHPIHA